MIDFMIKCELCTEYCFKKEDACAFEKKDGIIRTADVKDHRACHLRWMCNKCIKTIVSSDKELENAFRFVEQHKLEPKEILIPDDQDVIQSLRESAARFSTKANEELQPCSCVAHESEEIDCKQLAQRLKTC